MVRKYFAFALIAALAPIFVACSETTTPNETKPAHAGSGSTFTYTKTETDSTGTKKAGTDTVHYDRVLQGTHSFSGRDSAIVVIDSNAGTGWIDTTTMNYESSGDISIYRGNGIPGVPIPIPIPIPTWWTLPVQTKSVIAIMDTTPNVNITIGSFTVTIDTVRGKATYVGNETVTVGSGTLSCSRIDVVFNIAAHANFVGKFPVTLTTSYWYSDKIGYFAKYYTQNVLPGFFAALGYTSQFNVQELTSYNVK